MLQQVFGVGKGAQPGQPRRAPIQVGEAGAPAMVGSGDDSISQIFADDRTNSIILVSAERTYQRVFALIQRLEQQGSTTKGDRIHVYALENANADDMVQVLGGLGITVSYWTSEEAIRNWKANAEHRIAQETGKSRWYADYQLRVAKVERAYGKPNS